MIHLDDTDIFEIALGEPISTSQLPILISYEDLNVYGSTRQVSQTNGITPVSALEGPGKFNRPVSRKIKSISIENIDSSAHKIICQLNIDSVITKIFAPIIPIGATLFYEDGRGFYILDQFGTPITPTEQEMKAVTLTNSGGNAFVGTVAGLLAYTDQLAFNIRFAGIVDGPATANINSLGALALVVFGDTSMAGPSTGAANNDIKAGQIVIGIVDLPNNRIQIQAPTDNIQNDV